VRLGKVILKQVVRAFNPGTNMPSDWTYLAIEEPYARTNVARSVYDATVFAHIVDVFRESYRLLVETHDFESVKAIDMTKIARTASPRIP